MALTGVTPTLYPPPIPLEPCIIVTPCGRVSHDRCLADHRNVNIMPRTKMYESRTVTDLPPSQEPPPPPPLPPPPLPPLQTLKRRAYFSPLSLAYLASSLLLVMPGTGPGVASLKTRTHVIPSPSLPLITQRLTLPQISHLPPPIYLLRHH